MEDVRPLVHEASEHHVVQDRLGIKDTEVLESAGNAHSSDLVGSIGQKISHLTVASTELH